MLHLRLTTIIIFMALPACVISQISKSGFSVKINYGFSFSKFTAHEDPQIENRNPLVLSPQLSYNRLMKNKDLLEIGIGYYKVGNKLAYHDNMGNITDAIFNTNQVWGIPLTYYKNIDRKNNQWSIGLGSLFSYNFSKSVFTNTYADYTETTTHQSGLKVNLTAGLRCFLTAKERNFSVEVFYSQGLVKYYDVNITSNFSPTHNTVVNNGSGLHLGVTYFFIRNKTEE